MAGKAPLLLASVLFAVGAVGLALTSAERAEWGPFEPHRQAPPEQHVVIFNANPAFVDQLSLQGLLSVPTPELAAQAHAIVAASETAQPDPTPTPVPPLRIYGISSDDGGVSAAAATPTLTPIRIINVAQDDGSEPEPGSGEEPAPAPEPTASPD